MPTIRTLATALALVAVALSGCSGDDGGADDTSSEESPTTTAAATTTTEATSTTSDDASPDAIDSDPSDPPANALVILGDTLGILDSCAGRDDDGRVQYRYGLTNDGTFVVTVSGGSAVEATYDGFSGRFTGPAEGEVGDGFVEGSGTLADGAGTETEIGFDATIPLENCASDD